MLGAADLSTHACYLIYGLLAPGESGRVVRPGKGHEEIFCLVQGEAMIRHGENTLRLRAGEAFHLRGEETCLVDHVAGERVVYLISGGHSDDHSHS